MLLALNNNMKGFDLVLNTTKKHENKADNDKRTTDQVQIYNEETTKNTKRNEVSQPTITTEDKTRQTEEITHPAHKTMRASSTITPYPYTYTRQSTTTTDKRKKHENSTQMATSTSISPTPMANMQIEAKTEDIGVLNIILILISLILAIFCIFLVFFIYKTNKRKLKKLLLTTNLRKMFLPSPSHIRHIQVGVLQLEGKGNSLQMRKELKNPENEESNSIIEDTNKELIESLLKVK